MPALHYLIIFNHTAGSAWDKVHLKANIRRKYFNSTGCGITANGKYYDLIQPQKFKGNYTLV